MPRVPTYDSAQVAPQNLPSVQLSDNSHMMQWAGIAGRQEQQLGKEIAGFGSDIAKIALDMQATDNENDARRADAGFVKQADALMFGTTDDAGNYLPGYTQAKGDAAVKGHGAVVQGLQDLQQQALENAPNDAVRRMLQRTTTQRLQAYSEAAAKHAGAERGAADIQASGLRIEAAGDSAKKAYSPLTDTNVVYDPQADPATRSLYQQQLGTAYTELQQQASKLPEDVRAQFVKDGMEKIYAGAALHLANIGQPQQAKAYLDQLVQKDAIDQDVADKVRKMIEPNLEADRVLRYTDALFDSTRGEKAQKAQVRDDFEAGKLTGRERELAEARIEHRAAKAKQDENEWAANAIGQAQDYFIHNPGKSILDLQEAMPQVYRALSQKGHLAGLDAFAQREARPKSDPIAISNVMTYFGTGMKDKDGQPLDITQMPEKDWLMMRNVLSDGDWRMFGAERQKALRGESSADSLLTGKLREALNSRLVGIQVFPDKLAKGSDADKAYLGAIQQYAKDWVLGEQQAAGKAFKDKDIADSLNRLFAQNVEFRSTFLGFDMGADSKTLLKFKPSDIPKAAYEGIKKDLGPKATDQQILLQYWRLHGQR